MKRLFNPRKKSEGEPQEPANTLDRIVKDKEGVKKRLEEEEKTFLNKKREYEKKMIDFETQVNNQYKLNMIYVKLNSNIESCDVITPGH